MTARQLIEELKKLPKEAMDKKVINPSHMWEETISVVYYNEETKEVVAY